MLAGFQKKLLVYRVLIERALCAAVYTSLSSQVRLNLPHKAQFAKYNRVWMRQNILHEHIPKKNVK